MKIDVRKISSGQVIVDVYQKQSGGVIEHSTAHPAHFNGHTLSGEPEQLVGWPSAWMQQASLPDGNVVWVGVTDE